jgi:hypothetical protein
MQTDDCTTLLCISKLDCDRNRREEKKGITDENSNSVIGGNLSGRHKGRAVDMILLLLLLLLLLL